MVAQFIASPVSQFVSDPTFQEIVNELVSSRNKLATVTQAVGTSVSVRFSEDLDGDVCVVKSSSLADAQEGRLSQSAIVELSDLRKTENLAFALASKTAFLNAPTSPISAYELLDTMRDAMGFSGEIGSAVTQATTTTSAICKDSTLRLHCMDVDCALDAMLAERIAKDFVNDVSCFWSFV